MTLNGTLSDLGAAQLVQVPHYGRKTGELLVFNEDKEARFYYNQGKLVHALMGLVEGIEVLIDVIGWKEGEFEFRIGVRSDRQSIKQDLHQVLMTALVAKDERAQEKNKVNKPPEIDNAKNRIKNKLNEFVASTPFAMYTCVFDSKGTILFDCQAGGSVLDSLKQIQKTLHVFVSTYPRNLKKVFIEDKSGMVTLVSIKKDRFLAVFTNAEATLGVVTIKSEKLASLLAQEIE